MNLLPEHLLDHLPDAVFTVDEAFRPLAWNRAAERLLGTSLSRARKHSLILLGRVRRPDQSEQTRTRWSGRVEATTADGTQRVFDVHVMAGRGDRVIVARDVTELARRDRRLLMAAQIDDLTGLPLRSLFREQVARTIRRHRIDGRAFAVVYGDIDRFKRINDTFGHAAGDEVLRRIARRVQDALRPGDLFARVGGDEFAILLSGVESPALAERIGRRLLTAFSGSVRIGSSTIMASASLGIAWSQGADSAERLLSAADRAMYACKRTGRGSVLLAPITLTRWRPAQPAS